MGSRFENASVRENANTGAKTGFATISVQRIVVREDIVYAIRFPSVWLKA